MIKEFRPAPLRNPDLAKYVTDPFAGRSSEVLTRLSPDQERISKELLATHRRTHNPTAVEAALGAIHEQVSLRARMAEADDLEMIRKLGGRLFDSATELNVRLAKGQEDSELYKAVLQGNQLVDTFGDNLADAAEILGEVLDTIDKSKAVKTRTVVHTDSTDGPIQQQPREPEEVAPEEFPVFYR